MVAMETPSVPAAVPARSRILLVEDQTSIREMLSDVLARMEEFEVVGQAADVPEALRLARETQPDVVVLDWLFPNGTGLDFLRELRPSRLQCRVLVLTCNTNDESVGDALAFGARGFFEKVGVCRTSSRPCGPWRPAARISDPRRRRSSTGWSRPRPRR